MSIARKITKGSSGGSGGSGGSGSYVDDVFSTYLFNGTHDGVAPPQDIVNGIDLIDKGGLVWTKPRNASFTHQLFDTERGVDQVLETSSNGASDDLPGSLTAFNSNGFTLAGSAYANQSGRESASWTFAKQKGFFDVVTYTGDGVDGREIPHNLGSEPGMIIVKSTSDVTYWVVLHKDSEMLYLNESHPAESAATTGNNFGSNGSRINPTSTEFTVSGGGNVNQAGREYVAYLFAHDAPMFGPDGDESIIKCGSYTGNHSNDGPEIDLGWEPQFLLFKNSSSTGAWLMLDTQRGIVSNGNDSWLQSNTSEPEYTGPEFANILPNGFKVTSDSSFHNGSGDTIIYMAIRRPNKPAEEFEPEELFDVGTYTGNASTLGSAIEFPFNTDMFMLRRVDDIGENHVFNRLTEYPTSNTAQPLPYLATSEDAALRDAYTFRSSDARDINISQDSTSNLNISGGTYINYGWRRASGFFDVVTYKGDGVAGREVPHNLAAAPEMMWVKQRNSAAYWMVYSSTIGATKSLMLNAAWEADNSGNDYWRSVAPTSEVFTLGSHPNVNSASGDYIAFLWASVPGICDIGSYTGASQTIDCGFTNGARFVLIKRTDGTGNWRYYDTRRGIGATSSKVLFLDDTGGQQDDIHMVSNSSGFGIVTGGGTVGVSGAEYIYMAIA